MLLHGPPLHGPANCKWRPDACVQKNYWAHDGALSYMPKSTQRYCNSMKIKDVISANKAGVRKVYRGLSCREAAYLHCCFNATK